MALPQGINFRASSSFVTDGANESFENCANAAGAVSYPRTTAQGNTVGWENAIGNVRDRTTSQDRRLAGINFTGGVGWAFRIDLPSAGAYNVRAAFGDASSVNPTAYSLVDTGTVLGALCTGTNNNANSFKDANNIEWTAAAWPASNTARAATFSTSILRVRSDDAGANLIAHFYVEAASGGGPASYSYTASGGLVVSGTISTVRGRVKSASGGIQTGGAATRVRGIARSAAGGLLFAGSTSQAKGRAVIGSGGLSTGGAAAILRGVARSASGGLLFAGHASVSFTSAVQSLVVSPVGGIVFAGAALAARSVRKAAAGGLAFLGHASTVFFPPVGGNKSSILPEFIRRRRR